MAIHKSEVFEVEVNSVKHKLYFKAPNQAELFKIDLKYRQIFSEALRAGVMTESQLKKELAKNGGWTDEDDAKISKVSLDIANLQAVMNALKDKDEERDGILKIISKISESRAELIKLISIRTTMFAQSAEGIANEQRMHKLTELCLFDADSNDKFFESTLQYQEFASENAEALSEIYKRAYMFEYSTADVDIENYPEMKVLRMLAEREQSEVKVEDKSVEKPEVKPENVDVEVETKSKKKKSK